MPAGGEVRERGGLGDWGDMAGRDLHESHPPPEIDEVLDKQQAFRQGTSISSGIFWRSATWLAKALTPIGMPTLLVSARMYPECLVVL